MSVWERGSYTNVCASESNLNHRMIDWFHLWCSRILLSRWELSGAIDIFFSYNFISLGRGPFAIDRRVFFFPVPKLGLHFIIDSHIHEALIDHWRQINLQVAPISKLTFYLSAFPCFLTCCQLTKSQKLKSIKAVYFWTKYYELSTNCSKME